MQPPATQSANPDPVIDAQNVSKAYTIWSSPSARLHGPLLGQIGQMSFLPTGTRKLCNRLSHESFRHFHALKNISFSVTRGESVGIIGSNGAGKSTLLQIIGGTLQPTEGRVNVRGRVAALLELGSGFNAEFTGRENIYTNAAIRGLTREQTDAKIDEIIAFADIGDFIEQPIKTYSSGMVVRLAFGVQAVLDPDLLIVDEALAVGDEAFQRKCYARIQSIQQRGGTILFVTHATSLVVELCQRAILLDHGELLLDGPPKDVVARYHKLLFAPPDKRAQIRAEIRAQSPSDSTTHPPDSRPKPPDAEESFDPGMVPKSTVRYVSRGARIESPHITTVGGRTVNGLVRGREYLYTYRVRFTETAFDVRFGMLIKTLTGLELGGAEFHPPDDLTAVVEKHHVATVAFRFRCLLQTGVYFLNAGVLGAVNGERVYLDRHLDVAMFRVLPETGLLATGTVDFCIQPNVALTRAT